MLSRSRPDGACAGCLRRSWLLSVLSAPLDYCAGDCARLMELLALEDEQLIAAVGGRRRSELQANYQAFQPGEQRPGDGAQTLCCHQGGYPGALGAASAPRMLHVAGGAQRLTELTAGPVVAIVGSRRASDYGMEMAGYLAHGLAASGVTVTSGLVDGIAVAVHMGALAASGRTLAVLAGGLGTCARARRRLLERLTGEGCAVSELPHGCSGRRWGAPASARTIVALAALTIVVEAEEMPQELAPARMAQALGRSVAAIPGRLTSPLSQGTHALLMEGAHLLRGVEDALELLYHLGAAQPRTGAHGEDCHGMLEPRLQRLLERVGAGVDTAEALAAGCAPTSDTLLALSELELLGLLRRGDGGRYVPCRPLPSGRWALPAKCGA